MADKSDQAVQAIDWRLESDGSVIVTTLDSHSNKHRIKVISCDEYSIHHFYAEMPETWVDVDCEEFQSDIKIHCKSCSDVMIKKCLHHGEYKRVVQLQFETPSQAKMTRTLLESGFKDVKLRCMEAEIDPIVKLLTRYDLEYCGWMTFPRHDMFACETYYSDELARYTTSNLVSCKDLKPAFKPFHVKPKVCVVDSERSTFIFQSESTDQCAKSFESDQELVKYIDIQDPDLILTYGLDLKDLLPNHVCVDLKEYVSKTYCISSYDLTAVCVALNIFPNNDDTVRIAELFEQRDMWSQLIERSNVQMMSLSRSAADSRKEAFRNLLYKQLHEMDMLMTPLQDSDGQNVASHRDHIKGMYDRVYTCDILMMYPNTIISKNICYSDDGVIPLLLKSLMGERRSINANVTLPTSIRNARSAACKVCLNSVYYCLDAKLQALVRDGADQVRKEIKARIETDLGGMIILDELDTMIFHISPPHFLCRRAVKKIRNDFKVNGISLYFTDHEEKAIIMGPHKYVTFRNGHATETGISQKGRCTWIRGTYRECIRLMMEGEPIDKVSEYVLGEIEDLKQGNVDPRNLSFERMGAIRTWNDLNGNVDTEKYIRVLKNGLNKLIRAGYNEELLI
ncbi:Hypothetical protein POVR1_LOCUS200 [uncultured virus]|nr:Hypothetical protein POVR1_LOCUS200 [uncultured virus]